MRFKRFSQKNGCLFIRPYHLIVCVYQLTTSESTELVLAQTQDYLRLCYTIIGFRPRDLPFLATVFVIASIAVPLLGWELQRRRLISCDSQRKIEVCWVAVTTIVAASSWAIDQTLGSSGFWVEPFGFGFFVLIGFVILVRSGTRSWRKKKCLGVQRLLLTFVIIALHCLLFYACVFGALLIGTRLPFQNAGPGLWFSPMFLSGVVFIGIISYLLIVVLIISPVRRRYLDESRIAPSSPS